MTASFWLRLYREAPSESSLSWLGSVPMLRWPWLATESTEPIKWICRIAVGIILVHLLSLTYYLSDLLGLGSSTWLVGYLLALSTAFLVYLWKVEGTVLRAFRYVGPFDSISLSVLVFLSAVGSNLVAYSLAQLEPVASSVDAFAWTLTLAASGTVVGFAFQVLFRRLRGFLVSLPLDLLQLDTVFLLGVLILPLLAVFAGVDEPPRRYIVGTFSVAAAVGIVIGMIRDAREIWAARLRTRAYLVVFPKPRDKPNQKHTIEVALAQGRLNEASSLIADASSLSVKDREILLMTHSYLSGDFSRLRSWAKRDQLAGGSQRVLTLLANADFEEGRHREAINLLEHAPGATKNPYLQLNLALFFSFLGKLKEAVKSARAAYSGDDICPVITSVYVCLSYETADPKTRKRKIDEWLALIQNAAARYTSDYGISRGHDGSGLPQVWRSMLYLVMTEATLLIEKGDRVSLARAAQLLSKAEAMAPFDPWVRARIAAYYLELAKFADATFFSHIAVTAYRFKAHWQERSARRLVELDKRISERA